MITMINDYLLTFQTLRPKTRGDWLKTHSRRDTGAQKPMLEPRPFSPFQEVHRVADASMA